MAHRKSLDVTPRGIDRASSDRIQPKPRAITPIAILGLAAAVTVLIVPLVAATVAFGANRSYSRSAGNAPTMTSRMVSSGPSSMSALPGPVYDLAFDAKRNALWFASFLPAASLYRYDIAAGTLSQWALPPAAGNGLLSRVAVAPDESIWVTQDYAVSRLDPALGHVSSVTFDQSDVDADPLALARSNPSPGTWLSGLAFASNGDALVLRHNVKSIARLDSSLRPSGRIPLPASVSSPGDLATTDGRILVASYLGSGPSVTMDETGGNAVQSASRAFRYAKQGDLLAGLSYDGVTFGNDSSLASTSKESSATSPMDRIAVGPDCLFVYLDQKGQINRIDPYGAVTLYWTLPVSLERVWTPSGSSQTVNIRDDVGAMTVDGSGRLWLVVISGGASTLERLA